MANAELIAQIQSQIDALSDTTSLDNLVLLSVAVDNATSDRIITVATVSALPDLKTANVQYGTIFFVEEYNIPVIAGTKAWLGLDGRVIRADTPVSDIWAWGFAGAGQLGDGTTVNKSSPVSVVGGYTDWTDISRANRNAVGLRWNGTIWSWGCNTGGLLGDGTVVDKSSPVSLAGNISDWCHISSGDTSGGAAIRTNGTAWIWGGVGFGQTNSSSPVSIIGGFTDWDKLSVGGQNMFGIRKNGTLWSWGWNCCGSLGDGTTISKSSPVSVIGGFTDWNGIASGSRTAIGLRCNGTAWSWGVNCCGSLGNGTTVNRSSPVSLIGGFTDWCQVSIGQYSGAAIRTNGTAWTWGCGSFGLLGNGFGTNSSSPVSVVGGFTDWCQIDINRHGAGIRQNGTLWTWGFNFCGALGDGTTANKSSPVSVVGGFTNWSKVAIGANYGTIALRKF